ncbi:5-formyltetrahydrofolate cyclo-ligase [Rhizobium sp. SL86]|jgi:5-formyltetrahydrofolate cyclo-ligase|uniref:5-formyltetrahydrofolate cyclo-ligase n=1 Tax=Rhizobium sp. SL86 TaxID=2995148 RepID=UPI0022748D4D|nr:5-formyltetrahydrofolate cyclo-ligase [Rhizobium sp. SL86]MCY1666183.1 5-formyltetrahydrofolate cyclo-ligase [Rhizobium sp. SL86]
MSEVVLEKSRLRSERLAERDRIAADLRIEKSLELCDHGSASLAIEPGTIVSGFSPIRSEADIRPLMADLKRRGARLCLPVIVDKQTIIFRELVPGADLVPMGFGTFGPGPEAEELDPDLMLVPLSAFDAQGQRIGYGGGYYDRAIDRLNKKGLFPELIGIAFDCQEVASVPVEQHDVRLHAILTESGLRRFNP